MSSEASFYRFVLPGCVWRFLRLLGLGSESGSRLHFRLLDDYSRQAVAMAHEIIHVDLRYTIY